TLRLQWCSKSYWRYKMSGTADATATAIGRTKDGIPTWGGEASSFVQYEEAALLWEQSLTWEKRYTAGPKLVQELTGAARRLVSGQPAGWVAFRGGVTTLMDHLRKALGKPRVNEVTDLLATYFKGTRRPSNESNLITNVDPDLMPKEMIINDLDEEGASTTELLPQFIQGWYLLVDANLDANERNLVMTALGGNFDPLRVAQELRNQFSESDVRRRDGARRFQSYIGDTLDDEDDMAEQHLDETTEDILTEGMSEEGIALVVDAEQVAQDALAALHQAKRTLKDARHRQHQVRQNRKYFQGANHTSRGSSSTSSSRPRDDSQIECLRCGVKGHRVAQCPHKPLKETQGQSNLAESSSGDKQQAPFVCYTNSVAGYVSETGQPALPRLRL
ncbi:unnamed protein product, partial [Symbiodinium microadriaticum]